VTDRARTSLGRLYLVRHAIAAERGPAWPDDTKRPLTRRGIDRMRRAVDGLQAIGVAPEVVATSPLLRAEHTARLLVDGLGGGPQLVVMTALAPGHSPEAVTDAVAALPTASSVALVGHEPDLGLLAAWLLGTREAPVFKKGSVCALEVRGSLKKGGASLEWMATPRMLRAIRP